MKNTRKSTLAKQADKFFSFNDAEIAAPAQPASYPAGPVVVQTFTTYSACEDPIPDPRKQK